MNHFRCWIALITIIFLISPVALQGPKVQSAEYVVKNYADFDTEFQMAVVTATFDRDMFVPSSCNNKSTITQVAPCVNPEPGCIDTTPLNMTLTGTTVNNHQFKVTNPMTCDNVIVSLTAFYSDVDAYISFSTPQPDINSAEIFLVENWSEVASVCCEQVRGVYPTWDGSVYISVFQVAVINTTYGIRVVTDTDLPTQEFYWLATMELECNGTLIFDAITCGYGTGACFKLPPTEDPFFTRFGTAALIPDATMPFLPRQNSQGLYIYTRIFSSAQTSYRVAGISLDLLDGGSCQVRFPNLQDVNGEINLEWTPLTRRQLPCSAKSFAVVDNALSSVLDELSSNITQGLSSITRLFAQASIHLARNEWIGCVEQVEGSLAPRTVDFEYVTVADTRTCHITDVMSDEYLQDPCCNELLQVDTCCTPRTIRVPIPVHEIDSNALSNTCLSPRCSREIVNDYVKIQRLSATASDECQADAIAALTDPAFTTSPAKTCYFQVFKYACGEHYECPQFFGRYDTACLGLGYCTLPCVNDTDCVTGKCLTVQGAKTCLLYDAEDQTTFKEAVATLTQCFLNNTNDFIRAFVLQDLGLSVTTPNSQLQDAFVQKLTEKSCQSTFANPKPDTITDEQQCNSINTCNWAACNDAENPLCNAENCADPLVNMDEFCQVCYGACFTVSGGPRCEYLSYGTTQQECLSYPSSHWNPIANSLISSNTACFKLANTANQCLSTAYCSTNEISNNLCIPKCHFPTYTDATTCYDAGPPLNTTLLFIGPNICVATAVTNKAACDALQGGQWWPGVYFSDLPLSSQPICELLGYCYDGNLQLSLEADCIADYYCDGDPETDDETSCNGLGVCSDFEGCHLPLTRFSCEFLDSTWTPDGCYSPRLTASQCAALGGSMLTHASTREDCEVKAFVCQEAAQNFRAPLSALPPAGISLKNATECQKCGGTIVPFYSWTPYARWLPKQWTPFSFQKRNFTQGYFWGDNIDREYFGSVWTYGQNRRFTNIITSLLHCRTGASRSMLGQLACDCGTDQSSGCFTGITEQTVRSTQVCDVVPNKISFNEGSFEAFNDVEVVGTDCTDMPIAILPLSQFVQKRQVSLSSSAVSLSQSGRVGQAQIVKNSNGVAIGEIISSGILFDSNRTILRAQTCYNFPENFTSSLDVKLLDLATLTSNGDIAIFEPLGLNLPLDTKTYCIPYPGSSAVFPVALVNEWQETTFLERLYFEEVFVIYFGAGLYVAVLALWSAQLVLFLQKNVTRGYFQLPTAAFWILGVALLDRLLFLFLLPVGVLEKSRVATAIFAELPALLYYTIFSLIVLSWAKIYHFTASLNSAARYLRMKVLLITMNAFMGVAFIVILIVFFTLDVPLVITCEQDPTSGLSPQEVAAIVYKVVFSLFCCGLSVLFLIYGVRLIQLSNSLQTMSLNETDQNDIKRTKSMLVKKTVVTVIGTACLLGQAANLIRASLMDSNVFMLFFIYCVELVPVVSFVIILKKAYYRRRKPQQQSANAQPKRHIGSNYKPMPAASHYAAISSDKVELLGDVAMTTTVPKENHLTNISWSDISVQRDLGQGNFGTVSLGVWKGIQVALKRCKDPNNNEFLQEAQLMISIPHHPNVVKAFGTSQDGTSMVLVMEFCNGLSLDTKLFDMPDILTTKEKLQLLIGIAHGVNHLHKNKVIHRDLAARNVLLDGTGTKISDFGLSKKVDDVNEPNTTVDTTGPIRWMSPEALRGVYSSKTDVWTFGIVMYEVMTQCEPHIDEETLFVGLKIRDQGFSPHIPADCDRAIAELMTQCWNREPSMRPDMETICQALESKWKSDFGNESVHS